MWESIKNLSNQRVSTSVTDIPNPGCENPNDVAGPLRDDMYPSLAFFIPDFARKRQAIWKKKHDISLYVVTML